MPPAGCPTDQACYSQPQQLSSVQAAESADVPVFQQHQLPSELSAAKRDCTGRAVIKLWVSIDISGVSKSSFQDKVSTCSAKARAQEKKKKRKKHTTYLANAMFPHPNWPWTLPLVLPLVLFKFTPDTIQQFAWSNQETEPRHKSWRWSMALRCRRLCHSETSSNRHSRTQRHQNRAQLTGLCSGWTLTQKYMGLLFLPSLLEKSWGACGGRAGSTTKSPFSGG